MRSPRSISSATPTEATCLDSAFRRPARSVTDLAVCVGRGRRSAVGPYGFLHGGLIAEPGKRTHELLSPLERHLPIPEDWRCVLIEPAGWDGLHGGEEERGQHPGAVECAGGEAEGGRAVITSERSENK